MDQNAPVAAPGVDREVAARHAVRHGESALAVVDRDGRMLPREILAGLVIGVALASIAGPLAWWRWTDATLPISVGLSVFAASSTPTAAAMALPWIFNRVGLDPAFGSGPLAGVIQDLSSLWICLFVTGHMMAFTPK
jgi:Mg/Co/Ni transporter MgtE